VTAPDRNPAQQAATRENAAASPGETTPFDSVERGEVVLSLRECDLLAPLLEHLKRQYRRDGLRLSDRHLMVVARIVGAQARYKELSDLCTVRQAAKLLHNISASRVRALVYRGHLAARQVGGRWLIEKSSVMDRLSMMQAATARDIAPPAGERPPRDPGVPQPHLRQWADPTGNAAVATTTRTRTT